MTDNNLEECKRALEIAGKTNMGLMQACEEYRKENAELRAKLSVKQTAGDDTQNNLSLPDDTQNMGDAITCAPVHAPENDGEG